MAHMAAQALMTDYRQLHRGIEPSHCAWLLGGGQMKWAVHEPFTPEALGVFVANPDDILGELLRIVAIFLSEDERVRQFIPPDRLGQDPLDLRKLLGTRFPEFNREVYRVLKDFQGKVVLTILEEWRIIQEEIAIFDHYRWFEYEVCLPVKVKSWNIERYWFDRREYEVANKQRRNR